MEDYSRMDLMRMTDEDLHKILREEGEKLPTFTVSMIVDELKRRAETPESAYEEIDDEVNETEDPEEETEEAEEPEEEEKPEETDDLNLTPEEKLQKELELVENLKKERTKMLIIASVAALAAALVIVGFMLYLYFSGQL